MFLISSGISYSKWVVSNCLNIFKTSSIFIIHEYNYYYEISIYPTGISAVIKFAETLVCFKPVLGSLRCIFGILESFGLNIGHLISSAVRLRRIGRVLFPADNL